MNTDNTITQTQFDALCELRRVLESPSRAVANRVLVSGEPVAEAARAEGLSNNAGHQAVKRMRRGLELARVAAGH